MAADIVQTGGKNKHFGHTFSCALLLLYYFVCRHKWQLILIKLAAKISTPGTRSGVQSCALLLLYYFVCRHKWQLILIKLAAKISTSGTRSVVHCCCCCTALFVGTNGS